MYMDGLGVAQDYVEAMRWVRLAAAHGYEMGQFFLALMYQNGLGVAQNDAEAVR